MKRRDFIRRVAQTTAVVSTSALSAQRVLGANERIGIGVIGCGLIGRIHTRSFVSLPGAQVVAGADTFQPRLDAAQMVVGGGAKLYRDFRRLLEDKNVDAVVVATPDHWHALQTMMACAAGKDVYCEKPLTLFVREGRWMIDVARRYKRVVQVGTQQRSGAHYQRARDLLRAGRIGDIVSVQVNNFRNVAPGFGNPPDSAPPQDLDYDMWLGPAPQRPYNPNRALYHFRWFWDYSGGQMTNLGHHSLDIVHWVTGVKGPRAVTGAGGRYFLKDNCEVPDLQDAIIEYPAPDWSAAGSQTSHSADRTAERADNSKAPANIAAAAAGAGATSRAPFQTTVQFRECAAGAMNASTAGLTFQGTKGSMLLGRAGFEIVPDKKENTMNIVARIMGGHPVGGPQPVPEPEDQLWTEALKDTSGDSKSQFVEHAQNFLDCVKSRKEPNSDLESSHRVTSVCHLANISTKLGRKLRWDADEEQILGDAEANAMLSHPYRKPWDAELKALGVG